MDPLADKILVTAALIMLAADPNGARAPAWMVVVLLSRDMIITGLRSLAATQGTVVAASRWAKHKTAWSMLAIAFLLVGEPYVVAGVLIDFQLTGIVFLWIALIYSVTTGVDYFLRLRGMFT
jgi:CDP-diacylglycerol--glycerol-3-phosphate 3-phosphatidyltransferase